MIMRALFSCTLALAASCGFAGPVQAASAPETSAPKLSATARWEAERAAEARSNVTVPVWTDSIVQGPQSWANRPVRNWKDMRFEGVVRQQTDFSCGAAALATIFNTAYGRRATEQQVLVNMFKIADPAVVREKGFSLLDMKNYVRAIGMTGEGYSVPYDTLLQLRVPGIVLLNIKGYKHFVVIRRAEGNFVHIGDPALGNRAMSRRNFERAWNGVVFVVLGEGYNPDNVLRNPPSPLSARRLIDHYSPIRSATPEDFGFRNQTFEFGL
jgi:uncharacterized protein